MRVHTRELIPHSSACSTYQRQHAPVPSITLYLPIFMWVRLHLHRINRKAFAVEDSRTSAKVCKQSSIWSPRWNLISKPGTTNARICHGSASAGNKSRSEQYSHFPCCVQPSELAYTSVCESYLHQTVGTRYVCAKWFIRKARAASVAQTYTVEPGSSKFKQTVVNLYLSFAYFCGICFKICSEICSNANRIVSPYSRSCLILFDVVQYACGSMLAA